MAGFGPAVVDLVRYASSLHVACREMPWACDGDAAAAAYFTAYHEAIDYPVQRTPPAVVARLRRSVPQERETWLRWADTLMKPLPAAEEAALRDGWGRFIDLMLETRAERPHGFYRLVRVAASRWVSAAPSNRRPWRGSPGQPRLERRPDPRVADHLEGRRSVRVEAAQRGLTARLVARHAVVGRTRCSMCSSSCRSRATARRPSCGSSPGIAATANSPRPTCKARPS